MEGFSEHMGATGIAAKAAGEVAPRRKDPKPRHIDTSQRWAHVRNQDPNRKYVLVNTADPDAVESYKYDGYSVESRREGGAMLVGAAGAKAGSEQIARGNVLMSIGLDEWKALQAAGNERADEHEANMLAPQGRLEHDPIRGRHGLRVVNDSRSESEE